jgi:ankyrin repeat protein
MFNRFNRSIPTVLCTVSLLTIVGCDSESPSTPSPSTEVASDNTPAERPDTTGNLAADTSTSAADSIIGQAPSNRDRPAADTASDLSTTLGRTVEEAEAMAGRDSRAQNVATANQSIMIVAEPSTVDMGTMATGERKAGVITLRNAGESPRRIIDSRTSCGCTVANVPKGQVLEPGESVDVDVTLQGGTRAELLSKTVTFVIEDQPPLVVRVQGDVIAFVTIEPLIIDPSRMGDDPITIRATDGNDFRITSISPQVAKEFSTDAAEEHEIMIDWNRWEESGQPRRLLFYIDHPRTNQIAANIRVPATPHTHARDTAAPGDATPARVVHRLPADLIARGNTEGFLERMQEEGFDLEAKDRTDTTLLGVAAKHGNTTIMQALIDAGADIEATDRVGRTPLMHAAQSKNADAVRLLIANGAEVDRRDTTLANTALSWAAGFGDTESVRELLDAGAQVEIVSSVTGFTPLILAAGFGEAGSVKLLIDAGADIEAVDTVQNFTPAMYAATTGENRNLQALIEGNVNLEATDEAGRTVLLIAAAASGSNAQTIGVLLDAGAKIDAVDREGKNALDHARTRTDPRRGEVIAVLEPHFAAAE